MRAIPLLTLGVRTALVLVVVGLLAVFAIAIRLDPYRADGTPRRMDTHKQLGLPTCTFKYVTGLPCPSCGMTTSFALLMHGDLDGSLRANSVGTLLAVFCLAFIPWALACAVWGRPIFVLSLERFLTWVVALLLALMLLRWLIVLGLGWSI
jgi:hypothetical protein